MDKNQYKIISLGCDCFPRTFTTIYGLKARKEEGELSMPFDLCWSQPKTLIHFLETNFSDYFENIIYSEHNNYYINNKYQMGFNHDKDCPNTKEGYEKLTKRYKARIKNFENCINSDKFIFFIYNAITASEDECNEIYEILKEKRNKDSFKLIVLDMNCRLQEALLNEDTILCAIQHPFKNANDWWLPQNKEKCMEYANKCGSAIEKIVKNGNTKNIIKKEIKVSIIVPVYNAEKYLKKCINSLINQTLKEIEIIFVDDGSNDGSLEILQDCAKIDSRIKILTQDHKKQGAARNYGISVAKGEYIGFCDSDDWCELDMFEKFYNRAKETCADVTFCKIKTYDENKQYVVPNQFFALNMFEDNFWYGSFNLNDIEDIFFNIPVSPYNKLIRREFLLKNKIEFPVGVYFEDVIFSQLCVIKANKISLANISPYFYRINSSTSVCTAKDLTKFDIFKIFNMTKKILKQNNLYNKYANSFLMYKYFQIKYHRGTIKNLIVKSIYNIVGFFTIILSSFISFDFSVAHYYLYRIKRTLWLASYKIFDDYNIDLFFKIINKIALLSNKLYLFFLKKTIKNPAVIIETSWSHGETIPSIYKYFCDLGIKSDIIVPYKHLELKSLNCLENLKPKIRYVNYETLKEIFERKILDNYKIVFYNSFNTYTSDPKYYPNIFKVYNINNKKSLVCGFLHHLDYQNECKENNFHYFALTNLNNEYSNEHNFINPHYFGDIKITPKNKQTNFIIVGGMESYRRNVWVLYDAMQKLIQQGYDNFKVTCIGKINNFNVPSSIVPNIEFKGNLSYPKMYKQMENADFFLPLLDPENPEHDRYITIGTSGSFQLIYGFRKPCLIHEKFAKVHFLNNDNSIVYTKNEDLYVAMKQAIDMSADVYSKKQDSLNLIANKLYKNSLNNLKIQLRKMNDTRKPDKNM